MARATWTQRKQDLDFLHQFQQMYGRGVPGQYLTPKTGRGTGNKAMWEKMHGQFVKMRRRARYQGGA